MANKLQNLPAEILYKILTFNEQDPFNCNFKEAFTTIEYLAKYRSDLRDIYYRYCLFLNEPIRLNCFHSKHSPHLDELNKTMLFKFLAKNSNVIIAGGFATQLWRDEMPKITSDIDIFVVRDDQTISDIIGFIGQFVKKIEVPATNKESHNIFNFSWFEFYYKVQIICLKQKSIIGVLRHFDMSYCKCAIYMGKLYATPDAVYSLKYNKVAIYKRIVRLCRLKKALMYVGGCDSDYDSGAHNIINVRQDIPHKTTKWWNVECKCCGEKSKWRKINIRDAKIVFGRFNSYIDPYHDMIERELIVKKYNIDLGATNINYLEWCCGHKNMKILPVIQLNYKTDHLEYVNPRVFYTDDMRLECLLKYINQISLSGRKFKSVSLPGRYMYRCRLINYGVDKIIDKYGCVMIKDSIIDNTKMVSGEKYELQIRITKKFIHICHGLYYFRNINIYPYHALFPNDHDVEPYTNRWNF